MRHLSLFLLLVLASSTALAAGRVHLDRDTSLDFSRFRTIGFAPATPTRSHADLALNDLVRARLEVAIRSELGSKGHDFKEPGRADLVVVLHAAREELLEVDLHHGHRGQLIRSRRGTTLLVDLIERDTGKLVWRATVEDLIGLRNPTGKQVTKSMERVFRRFPD